VRFAPSPTGSIHLGGLRTALFNYLFAKKHGGSFIIRIEDTDQAREVPGSIEELTTMLQWCGVEHDEGPGKEGAFGPYTQSKRLPIYHEHAQKLVDDEHAYPCFCDAERLASLRASQTKQGLPTKYDGLCSSLSSEDVAQRMSANEPHVIRLKVRQHPFVCMGNHSYRSLQVPNVEGVSELNDIVRGSVRFSHGQVDDQVGAW
jgi:glutamyl/glutaminyl-tRNA synthetase